MGLDKGPYDPGKMDGQGQIIHFICKEDLTLETQKMDAKREDVLLKTMLGTYFLCGLTSIFGSLLPFLRQAYGLSYEVSGLLISCKSVGNLVAMLGSGLLALYLGRRRSALVLAAAAALSYLLLASRLGGAAFLMGV